MTMRFRLPTCLVLTLWLCAHTGLAQNRTLVTIQDLTPREVQREAFSLDASQDLHVEAVGGRSKDRDRHFWDRWSDDEERRPHWPGNAWILNARTREVVWELNDEDTRSSRNGLRTFEGTVRLPAGVYEAYFASFAGEGYGRVTGSWLRNVSTGRKGYRDGEFVYWGAFVENRAFQEFKLVIEGAGQPVSADAVQGVRDEINETAIVSLTGLGDNAFRQVGFRLDQPTEIEFYALGEVRRDGAFDYGWIIDADTHKRLWTMDYFSSDYAGGSDKNRMVHQRLTFPAGRYVAFFATDDSHSSDAWNASPAYDPDFWGLTLRVPTPADRAHVQTFAYEHVPDRNVFVSLTGLGNHETQSQAFRLKRPADLRIYALGEGSSGDMYDYGWIIDTRTRQRVWEMKYRNTEHAGGAQKNRLIDEVVSFDAGEYVVYFITDDSHAYQDWNDSPPYDQKRWGITMLTPQGPPDEDVMTTYAEKEDPRILAELVQIRDDARRRQRFTLGQESEVHIYALGEGRSGDMYDYGWIEEAQTGRTVWEMKYRMTDHAGGARKNRVADVTVVLPAGDYVLYYRSDGSHSYSDWNAAPPHDPIRWGITVYHADKP